MQILVTGGAGFIGFYLSKYLADQGHKVVICDNLFRGSVDKDFSELIKRDSVSFVQADLTEKSELDKLERDFDIVYHLAAINGTKYFYEVPHEVLRVNILSLLNMLDWLVQSKCGRMVWTSSSEVYAGTAFLSKIPIPTPEEVPLAISDEFNPRFSYAGSKIVGELLCINYAKAHGLNIIIVRPHNIYGPRMGFEHVIPEFIEKAQKASMIFPAGEAKLEIQGSGNETRAFCYIDDMVKALTLIAEKGRSGEIYNVGNDGEEISIRELAEKVAHTLGLNVRITPSKLLAGSSARRCPDIGKLRGLGFNPGVTLDVGLKKTVAFYTA